MPIPVRQISGDLPFRLRSPMERFRNTRSHVPSRLYRAQYSFPPHLTIGRDIDTNDSRSTPDDDETLRDAVARAAQNSFDRNGPFLLVLETLELAENMVLACPAAAEVVTLDPFFIPQANIFKLSDLTQELGIDMRSFGHDQAETELVGWLILHRISKDAIISRIGKDAIEQRRYHTTAQTLLSLRHHP
jgi:hypothetical protein